MTFLSERTEVRMRNAGILLHISSLPGPDGIGSLGQEAYDFADFLHEAGFSLWQVLPMGPTGYGESPYQSSSVFAGNPLLISLKKMETDGLLGVVDEARDVFEPEDLSKIDYAAVRAHKMKLLRLAFYRSEESRRDEIRRWMNENSWVRDYALFTAVKEHLGGAMWTKWPDDEIRMNKKSAREKYRIELLEDYRFHIFCQWVFFRQWEALKKYCNERGIRLFGDMPIYVAEDSADTWTHPEVFQLDRDRIPKRVAGVPPDYFSADGQLWGNPLYRWHRLRFHGYDWWVERMRRMAAMYDIIRVDHFIGFANYYSIPYGAKTAREGKWIVGPGKSLFKTFNRKLPGLNIVAEDLGCVTDRVRKLIDFTGYPGMKVLVFGFDGKDDTNEHLPANYKENIVAYTGTHDNNTVRGWIDSADEKAVAQAKRILGFDRPEDAPAAFVKAVLASRANMAVIAMQDILGLDASACMNHPGSTSGNWLWRMNPGAVGPKDAARLRALLQETGRLDQ